MLPSPSRSLLALDSLARGLDEVIATAKGDLPRFFISNTYPPSLLDKVKLCLADIQVEEAAVALLRIRELHFPVNDYNSCLKSARVVQDAVLKVRQKLAGSLGRSAPPEGHPVTAHGKRGRSGPTPRGHTSYSRIDADLYSSICSAIGEAAMKQYSNSELWRRRRQLKLNSGMTYNEFRHKCDRIRRFHGFPSSGQIPSKKNARFWAVASDQD